MPAEDDPHSATASISVAGASAGRQSSDVLLRVLAERDSELGDRLGGVAKLASATAVRLGVPEEDMEAARQTALLHDVGMVAIPEEILHKPGPLDESEWAFMKRHTVIGERIISAAPALAVVARFVRSTHERYDGRGYPDALAGDDIPLIARVVAVCDAYDAMVTDRTYRDALDRPSAIAELRHCSGTQFDAEVVEAFASALEAAGDRGQVEATLPGQAPEPLVAPEEWQDPVHTGALPLVRLDGAISKVYGASMADWPWLEMLKATEPSVAEERDQAGDQRDEAGDQRDQAGDQRDQAGDQRDQAGDQRDQAADQRDQAADQRDQAAEQSEALGNTGITTDALSRSALARREAASDRRRASQDRRAGASERTRAELDRSTALADRGAGATERTQAELDRSTALTDRGASARDREYSSADDLTGAYLRGPGFVALERDIARARRTEQPLVLAFVDVDRLKAINDSQGHAAGDRLLLEVANTFRAKLRSYDLIIRYGGDEFVCAISGLNMADATKRLALVNAALAEGPEHGSVTVGIAELQPDDSPEDLVARADAALYRNRQQQRTREDEPLSEQQPASAR